MNKIAPAISNWSALSIAYLEAGINCQFDLADKILEVRDRYKADTELFTYMNVYVRRVWVDVDGELVESVEDTEGAEIEVNDISVEEVIEIVKTQDILLSDKK